MFNDKETIERLKAAAPPGGYKDIGRIWYFAYFALSTVFSIAAAYYLADHLPKHVPPESPFFISFIAFMAFGVVLVRRWHKKHDQP